MKKEIKTVEDFIRDNIDMYRARKPNWKGRLIFDSIGYYKGNNLEQHKTEVCKIINEINLETR